MELYGLYKSLESTFFETRLVFSPSTEGIHPDKLALQERGIRIATIFHRIFGKSTTVLINGSSYILNTNSLNKYCDKMFKLGGVNDSLEKRAQVIVNESLKNSFVSLPSLMGEDLLRLHLRNNSVEVEDTGNRPLRTVSRGLSFSSISDPSEKAAKVKEEFEAAEIELKKTTEILKSSENNRLIKDLKEICMSLIAYAEFALKESKELISLGMDNKDVIQEKVKAKLPEIEAFIEKLAAKKDINPELVKLFISDTKLLATSVLKINEFFSVQNENVHDENNHSSMNYAEYFLEKMTTLYSVLEEIAPDLQLFENQIQIVMNQGESLYKKSQEGVKRKKEFFPLIAKFRTEIIISQIWANRASIYKVAKKNLQGVASAELPQTSNHFSRMKNKVGTSILGIIGRTLLSNQETAVNKLIECVQKDVEKAQVKRRLSDTDLLDAEKAYAIAKKNYDSKKRAFESLNQVPVNSIGLGSTSLAAEEDDDEIFFDARDGSELEIPLD